MIYWLVVLTMLKHISQWEGLSHMFWNIKNVWNHQPVYICMISSIFSRKTNNRQTIGFCGKESLLWFWQDKGRIKKNLLNMNCMNCTWCITSIDSVILGSRFFWATLDCMSVPQPQLAKSPNIANTCWMKELCRLLISQFVEANAPASSWLWITRATIKLN